MKKLPHLIVIAVVAIVFVVFADKLKCHDDKLESRTKANIVGT